MFKELMTHWIHAMTLNRGKRLSPQKIHEIYLLLDNVAE